MFTHRDNTHIAWLLRSKFLTRWPLMRVMSPETVSEHSFEVGTIAFLLAVVARVKFDRDVNPERVCALALHHEYSEAGGVSDIPQPIKYANPEVTAAIKKLEVEMEESLIACETDPEIRDYLKPFINQSYANKDEKYLVKTADHISMLIKAKREMAEGNREYSQAILKIEAEVAERAAVSPEIKYFMDTYYPHCIKPLDDLQ